MFARAVTILILMLFSGLARAAVISEIRFEGNEVTQEIVMLREMIVVPGDVDDQARIEESVQNIMNLGLFERVTYRTEAGVSVDSIVLVVTVVERYYIIPLPTAKLNGDNQLEYGAKLRWDNVWGMNHRLRWDLINKGSTLGVRQFTNNIEYLIPRPYSSRYEVALNFDIARDADDDPINGPQLQLTAGFGFDVQKWLSENGISRGLFVAGGIGYRQKKISSLGPAIAPEQNQDAVIYSARVGYDDITEYEFNRSGAFLQYKVEYSNDDRPGFSVPFVKQEINYTHLHSFNELVPENYNYNIAIGHSDNDVLGDKAFSLGGNTNLRGYKTAAFRGNAMLRINMEYLSIFGDSPYLRKVFFIDTGDAQEELSDMRFSTLKTGVGAGIRWKLRRFVDLDIRLDLAYGFETSEFRVGLGTHNTF